MHILITFQYLFCEYMTREDSLLRYVLYSDSSFNKKNEYQGYLLREKHVEASIYFVIVDNIRDQAKQSSVFFKELR